MPHTLHLASLLSCRWMKSLKAKDMTNGSAEGVCSVCSALAMLEIVGVVVAFAYVISIGRCSGAQTGGGERGNRREPTHIPTQTDTRREW